MYSYILHNKLSKNVGGGRKYISIEGSKHHAHPTCPSTLIYRIQDISEAFMKKVSENPAAYTPCIETVTV